MVSPRFTPQVCQRLYGMLQEYLKYWCSKKGLDEPTDIFENPDQVTCILLSMLVGNCKSNPNAMLQAYERYNQDRLAPSNDASEGSEERKGIKVLMRKLIGKKVEVKDLGTQWEEALGEDLGVYLEYSLLQTVSAILDPEGPP